MISRCPVCMWGKNSVVCAVHWLIQIGRKNAYIAVSVKIMITFIGQYFVKLKGKAMLFRAIVEQYFLFSTFRFTSTEPLDVTCPCHVHWLMPCMLWHKTPNHWLLANKARIPCKICGWQCGIGVGPSLSLSVCPCKFLFYRCSTLNPYPVLVQRKQMWDFKCVSHVSKQRLLTTPTN
jgi:hypothetical protein